ncbi:hypothetical protein RHGRI_017467 [Rhododendron griersonianum]|uniref:Heat shock protein 70 n=1 Tax=Rhododendron griersonianum TaxID=479676 RepID=A0AAV6JXY4_9ERIC|nr:hypothetical protein RHGRI_017467 [Rhododendron griersonianum]
MHLGGDDCDKRIVDWLAGNFKRDEGIDLLKDKQALQRLTEAAKKAKMELSSLTQTTLTRAKFEELCSDLLDRCIRSREILRKLFAILFSSKSSRTGSRLDFVLHRLRTPVENALRDAKLSFKDIDEVILVGGSTRIPAVQELVRKQTGKEPNVTVKPDEVVALGAAVQAGVLAGDVSDIVLLDVTPLSLGLETLSGVMTKIMPKNTTLPTSKSEVFSTAADGQTSIEINVLQVRFIDEFDCSSSNLFDAQKWDWVLLGLNLIQFVVAFTYFDPPQAACGLTIEPRNPIVEIDLADVANKLAVVEYAEEGIQ